MNTNWATPTIDIFNLDYPPINNIFRQPFEPFSLDSSHALTRMILGCSSAYGMHVIVLELLHVELVTNFQCGKLKLSLNVSISKEI